MDGVKLGPKAKVIHSVVCRAAEVNARVAGCIIGSGTVVTRGSVHHRLGKSDTASPNASSASSSGEAAGHRTWEHLPILDPHIFFKWDSIPKTFDDDGDDDDSDADDDSDENLLRSILQILREHKNRGEDVGNTLVELNNKRYMSHEDPNTSLTSADLARICSRFAVESADDGICDAKTAAKNFVRLVKKYAGREEGSEAGGVSLLGAFICDAEAQREAIIGVCQGLAKTPKLQEYSDTCLNKLIEFELVTPEVVLEFDDTLPFFSDADVKAVWKLQKVQELLEMLRGEGEEEEEEAEE
jgi:hypothetical protein